MEYVKPERLSLRGHATLNEAWVEARIAEDPAILGLGELTVRDSQRRQPRAGRLDLLLQDEDLRRYEVELQLGATDETHIIRTLEYWDIERKRYPQYEHCAVIIAEDITSRFLNVISLFNGSVPIIAIQMSAFQLDDKVMLTFTTVLDEVQRGLVDEDEEVAEPSDRNYWEARSSKESMQVLDGVFDVLRGLDGSVAPKYNRPYVGVARNGVADNILILYPKRTRVTLMPKLAKADDVDVLLDKAGIETLAYAKRLGRYRLSLRAADLPSQKDALRELFTRVLAQDAG